MEGGVEGWVMDINAWYGQIGKLRVWLNCQKLHIF